MSLITILLVHKSGECGCGLLSFVTAEAAGFLPDPLLDGFFGEPELSCAALSPSTLLCAASDLSVVLVTLLHPGDKTIPAWAGAPEMGGWRSTWDGTCVGSGGTIGSVVACGAIPCGSWLVVPALLTATSCWHCCTYSRVRL